jgi:diguanylate cyclase (GGDEF)-like protein
MQKKVLIIDDSENIRAQIADALKTAALFERIYEAGDGIEALKMLLETPVDLILCDLEMPRIDGYKLLGMIVARHELSHIPVIMLTGHGDSELKVKLLGQGASDYITKPFDAAELIARVKVHLKIKHLQDELKKSNEKLQLLSDTDPLTQIYNRRYMMNMLEKELLRAERKGTHLSLVMIDLDHFKQVNDKYGHDGGDQVLIALAALAQAGLRSYDFFARYGGEEFVMTLPETAHEDALMIADRLRRRIQLHSYPGTLKGLSLTASMGVATYPVQFISSLADLVREADEAMYRAKTAGRNRVFSMNQH